MPELDQVGAGVDRRRQARARSLDVGVPAHQVRHQRRPPGPCAGRVPGLHRGRDRLRRAPRPSSGRPHALLNVMKRGLPGDSLRVVAGKRSTRRPLTSCCTLGWICHGIGLMSVCSRTAGRRWPSWRSRPTVPELRRLAARFSSRGSGAGGDRVDERRPVRARHLGAGRLGGGDRRRPEGEGAGAVGVQDRPDRCLGAGRAVPPGSGAGDLAARPGRCGPIGNGPGSGCIWCIIGWS